ncbi:MAG: DedA family protein [Fretibacterium sp.]|nr:DedA family protein [Fretibacterium sp.]
MLFLAAPLRSLLGEFTAWLVNTIGRMGYTGITALMFLESSFFPFPSEVVMPPAGYLAWKGEMSLWAVLAAGIAGSILGALFNYWVAVRLGRPLLLKYGRYFFISEESVARADAFFLKHGHVSTLVGRLLPVIRQYISLPAGIARMPLGTFTAFTALGAGVWVTVLTFLGYLLGEHQEFLARYLHLITLGCVGAAACIAGGYVLWMRRRNKQGTA